MDQNFLDHKNVFLQGISMDKVAIACLLKFDTVISRSGIKYQIKRV